MAKSNKVQSVKIITSPMTAAKSTAKHRLDDVQNIAVNPITHSSAELREEVARFREDFERYSNAFFTMIDELIDEFENSEEEEE